ncbi:cupin domain-containing protein [Niveibacterium sp. SC-1]|uniref:(R)-mandelonitrile lyase n=1 Tax=Niveibacterium sp. SC-1 TaxID=3135646 RepID=UPI00311D8B02
MKPKSSLLPAALAGSLLSGAAPAADTLSQIVTHAGAQPSMKGPEDYFTGSVRVDPLFAPSAPASYSGGAVSFEAGARSAWHTHPAGQYLLVTAGVGRVQEWGGPLVELRAGDVVWCPPGVKHWHGAAPAAAMTHIAITGVRDGKNVEWLEQVSDEQYRREAVGAVGSGT